ncbi:MAG TPA: MarR family transcriptional regulator [Thermomonospora sp.]|nr:MarR family transcriptional regulator [Thermomonospora sp.]
MEQPDRVDEMMRAWRAELPEVATVQLELVKRAGRLAARCEEATALVLAEHRMTYAEFDVLATLRRSGPPYRLKPGALARQSMLSSGGISNILLRLSATGLVERRPDPDDGRSSWVCLTEAGRRTAEDLARATSEANARLFEALPAHTAEALAGLLRETLVALGDVPETAPVTRPR